MKYRTLYLLAFTVAGLSALMIYACAELLGVPLKTLTRDPYSAAQVPPYYGYFSLVGSSIWMIANTSALTTALVLRKIHHCRISHQNPYGILFLGGIIGLAMAIDDILLIHDALADRIGIPRILFHVAYFVAVAALIVYSRGTLRQTPWLLFFSALFCLGLSSLIDLLSVTNSTVAQAEEVPKFCGITIWAFYFGHVSWELVARRDFERTSHSGG